MTSSCKECSAEFSHKPSIGRVYCSVPCRALSQTRNNIGASNPNYRGGKSSCVDCGKSLGVRYNTSKRCRPCYAKFARGANASNWKGGTQNPNCINCDAATGDRQSILCRQCYRGELHPQWKGGVSSLQALVRNMPENRQWIKQCLYRDGYACVECSTPSNGVNLQVDHIRQFASILSENNITSVEEARMCADLWDISNGRTLCKPCHKLTSSYGRKLH